VTAPRLVSRFVFRGPQLLPAAIASTAIDSQVPFVDHL
jgi:hypothetical protein